jgi:hypothetical protein
MNTVHTLTILFSHLCLVLSSRLSCSGFTQENHIRISHLSHVRHEHCPFHTSSLTDPNHIWQRVQTMTILHSFFSYPPATSILLALNILPDIFFSNTTLLEIKFHTHTKQLVILHFVNWNIYVFRWQMWWQAVTTIQAAFVCSFLTHKILIIQRNF